MSSLSNDLVSQFIKSTNDTKPTKKDTIVYGTVTSDDKGNVKVRFDGSIIDTPVETTSAVKVNDRVMVTIKNHTAIVTGNLSDRSASNNDFQSSSSSVSALTLEYGKFKTLTTNNFVTIDATIESLSGDFAEFNAVVTDNLDTINARIDKIIAGDITADLVTTDELNASIANITTLISDKATIAQLEAVQGDIQALEGATANIGDLTAKVGKIDTLIYGSASGNSIHSSFANSVVALVGDAKIKSAMIESINASKITAGDIITNNVAVKSYDGRLVISDETIQISDSSRVRVQIGKDATNDYSINIWDDSGNLMFSKGGITDKAIKSGIIRNDMVSDSADISASKLDIDSLFSVINNDGSNTLKSTKIKLDEKNQTLEVAFNSLSSTVTNQGETIFSYGTRLSVVEGQIENEVWTQSIDELDGKYNTLSTDYSRLMQTVEGISSEVSSNTSRIAGGTNLLTDDYITMYDELKGGGEYYNYSTSTRSLILFQNLYLEPGTYTFSCQVKQLDGTDKPIDIQSRFRIKKNTVSTYYDSNATSGGWTRWSVTIEVTSTSDKYDFFLHSYDSANNNVPKLWVKKLKVEKGSFATEDINSRFENAEGEISSAKTYITQLSDRVSANITETTNLGTRTSTLEQTAASLTVSVKDAAKTATSYLNYSTSGLVIGDLTASILGNNVLIDSDSVDIRNGNTTLASFGKDYLYLAKNSKNARIDLCNGLAQMYHETDNKGYSIFNIDTTYGLSYIKMSAPMHDLLVLENTNSTNGVIIKGIINGATVGGFGLVRNGNMVRYGSDADDDNPVENVVLDTGNFLTEMDSGWQYTAGYGENFTQYNNEEYAKVRYRKIGGMVEIRGVMRPTTTIAGSTTLYELFTLGEKFRPATYLYHRCSGSYANTWLMTIAPSGRVSFSRYGSGNSYAQVDTSAWLPIHVTFMLD